MKKQDFNNDWLWLRDNEEAFAVRLPHDAMQYAERYADAPTSSGCGYYEGGIYRYRKTFFVPENWASKHILFQFEGVYQNSTVKINGNIAGGEKYGYIPFFVEADDHLQYGMENVIEVEADNSKVPNSRWYTGGGIYRPVWLWIGEKGGLEPESVKITTLSCHPATIAIKTEPIPDGTMDYIIQKNGKTVAVSCGENTRVTILDAMLWDAQSPERYQCIAILKKNGVEIDRSEINFGIRVISWSNNGLFINGKKVKLKGGCLHHDNGILGARSYAASEWRKVETLKKAGFNAIRSSHNPANPALIEVCDTLGVYLIDETWDMWYKRKNPYDYAVFFEENWKSDVKKLVERDYNHPSIIMYSIGNEVSEPASEKGMQLAKEIIAMFHSLDDTRPVTGGMNLAIIADSATGKELYGKDGGRDKSNEKRLSGMSSQDFNKLVQMVGAGKNDRANTEEADAAISPIMDALDIAGYNYGSGRYLIDKEKHPDRVIFGSETFPQDIAKNWAMVEAHPHLIGDFMWTAWDYIGETGSGAWAYTEDGRGFDKPYPWLLADMGAFDILGNPGGEVFQTMAVWKCLPHPVICVQPVNHPDFEPFKSCWRGTNSLPSWSWRGCDGNRAVIEVYAAGEEATLYVNEKIIATAPVTGGRAVFETVYEPGTIWAEITGPNKSRKSSAHLCSARGNLQINVTCEKSAVPDDNICYVNIAIVGENQIVESNADTALKVTVTGGELLGMGSARPRTEENYLNGCCRTYYGRAQAVVFQADETCSVTVSGDNMETVTVTL